MTERLATTCPTCEALHERVRVLEAYLSDDLLRRLAVENDWPHEPDNTRGIWCCDDHERRWRDGTLYGDIGSKQ